MVISNSFIHGRSYFTTKIKLQLCDSLVLSQFNHCSQVFSPCLDSETYYKIQKVQNSCLSFAFGIRKFQRISHKLTEASWLNMSQRFRIQELRLYHNIMVNKEPAYLYNKIRFRTDVHNVNIRRKDLLSVPLHKLSIFERSFTFRVYRVGYGTINRNCFRIVF